MGLKPVPYREFLEAGTQWTLPIQFVKNGAGINLDGHSPTATLRKPDDSAATPPVVTARTQVIPDIGWADVVVLASQTILPALKGDANKYQLRAFLDGEPAEWYQLEAQAAI